MRRLLKKTSDNEKKTKEIQDAILFAQNFTIQFQNIYNEMQVRLPIVRSLLDVQAVQIYQIMLEKLKKSIISFNKTTITDKLNLLIQNINLQNTIAYYKLKKEIKKISFYTDDIVEQAKQLKSDLLIIRDMLKDLYEQGKKLAELTKNLLNHHAKHSVLKRIKNIKKVVRWLDNDDGFDTDIVGRLNKIIYNEIPKK